jgi:hypothetical protein
LGIIDIEPYQAPVTRSRLLMTSVCASWVLMVGALLAVLISYGDAPSTMLLLVSAAVVVLCPGMLIVELAGIRGPKIERLTVAIAVGLVAACAGYALAGLTGIRWLVPWCGVAATVTLLVRGTRRMLAGGCTRPSVRFAHAGLAGVVAAALAPLAVVPIVFRNLSEGDGGLMVARQGDPLLHLALSHELQRAVPPTNPLAAETALSYHWGADLLPAALTQMGVSIGDAVVRGLPALYMMFTAFALFCLGRLWLSSAWGGVLFAGLTLIGEDLSWVLGLITQRGLFWSVDFLAVPTTFSFMTLNPMLPALGLLATGLLCLVRWLETGSRAWLYLTAICLAALAPVKVFVFAQFWLALGVTAVARWFHSRDRRLFLPLLLVTGLAAPILALTARVPGARVEVGVEVATYLQTAVDGVGLAGTWIGDATAAVIGGDFGDFRALAAVVGLVLPLYLLASLGARIIAVPLLFRDLLRPQSSTPARQLLAVLILVGPPLSLFLSVTVEEATSGRAYNNAVWFFVLSKDLMWLFAVQVVLRRTGRRPLAAIAAGVLLVVVSVPSTVQAVKALSRSPLERLPTEEVRVLNTAEELCRGGAVALASPAVAWEVAGVAGCRLTVHGVAATTAPVAVVRQRLAAVDSLWQKWTAGTLTSEHLARLPAEFVITGPDVGAPPPRVRLHLLRKSGEYAIYEIPKREAPRGR